MATLVAAALLGVPAQAQPLDELKQQLQDLRSVQAQQQKRIDQLEAALRQSTKETAPRSAKPAAARRATPSTEPATAQQAAAQARQSAEQAKQAAAQAEQTADRAKQTSLQAVKDSFTPPPGKPAGTFRIPNTGVSVRLYGMVKLNAIWDQSSFNRAEGLTAQSIALSGSPAARTGGDFQMSARRSRFGIESWAPTDTALEDVHALVEMDFAGQNTDLTTQSTANSYTPRLRRAFFDFGQPEGWGVVLIGQENSLFSDAAIFPLQWLADWTPGGMSGVRQAQARYTYGFGDGITASIAVENSYSDITSSTGASFPDSNGGGGVGFSNTPDFTARLMVRQEWGQVALRGVVRPQIELNNLGAPAATSYSKSTSGWGIGATGSLNLLGERLILMASGNFGDGIGRYLDATSNAFSAVSNAGLPGVAANNPSLNPVRVAAGLVGAQLNYTSSVRTNMSLFGAQLMNYPGYVAQFAGCFGVGGTGTCGTVNRSLWGGSVNLIWSPVPSIDVGVEYQHIERSLQTTNATGNSGGNANRVQVSGIARF